MNDLITPGENNKKQNPFLSFFKTDSGWLGLVPGIIGPFLGFYVYYQIQFSDTLSLHKFIRFVSTPDLLSKVMSLSVLMNLPIFFIFIQLKYDLAARAVLGATFVYGAIIAYFKFFG